MNVIGRKYDSGRFQILEQVADAADLLEKWMGENCGDNADWPINIKADEDEGERLALLLTELHQALIPYREEDK